MDFAFAKKKGPGFARNVEGTHEYRPTSTRRTENLIIPAGESGKKMFPIQTEELLPSLLGNVLLRNISHSYWETFLVSTGKNFALPLWDMFRIPTGKRFPSLQGNVSHQYWETFPLPAGKHFPFLHGNISPSCWERFPIFPGKGFPF